MKNLVKLVLFFSFLSTCLHAASDDYTLTIDSPDFGEGTGSTTVNIRVTPQNKNTNNNGAGGDHIVIHYQTQNAGGGADATAGSDYTTIGSTQLTITPDSDGLAVVQVPVTILQDTFIEGDEEFSLVITSASANNSKTVAIADGGLITILDDETGTLPSLSIEDKSIAEEAGSVSVRVSLSMISANPVTFSYATVDGTATSGNDYNATGDTATISAGSLFEDISIPILGDLVNEGDETFEIYISSPTNATIGDVVGVVTILDDDTADSLSINDASIAEGDIDKNVTIKIILSAPSVNALNVTYHTVEGSATEDVDYVHIASGSVTIPTGSSEYNLTVTIKGDTLNEGIENFYLILDTVTGTTVPVLADLNSTITIFDDDSSGTCSSYVGLMTLNEYQNNPHYFEGPRNDPASKITGNFVEIKYIDFLVKRFVTDDWSVSVHGNAGSQDILWRDKDPDCVDPRYEVFQFGNNVMGARGYVTLKDNNGNEVDVLAITTDSSDYYTQQCHDFVYDTDYALSAQNKDLFRVPDGTGDWVDHGTGANSGGSRCVNKDGWGGLLFTGFDAIDIDETPNTPIQSGADVPIKTKVVNSLFSLDILSLEVTDPTTAGNLKNSSVTIKVYLADENGNRLPSSTNIAKDVVFTDSTTVRVPGFIYDRAVKIARVAFEYCGTETGTTGDWDTCYNTGNTDDVIFQRRSHSRNRFAIRPKQFDIGLLDPDAPNLLRAGQKYGVSLTAWDENDAATNDYTIIDGSFITNLMIETTRYFKDGVEDTATPPLLFGGEVKIDPSSTAYSVNGLSSFNTSEPASGVADEAIKVSYPDVGKVEILIYDPNWASIDNDDTNTITCDDTIPHTRICGDKNVTFIPHHFEFKELNITNHAGSTNNFTYVADKRGMPENGTLPIRSPMASRIHTQIRALTEDGNITQNFRKDFGGNLYYENNITVTQNVEMPTVRTGTEPNAYIFGAGNDVNESEIDNKLVGFGRTTGAETDDPGTRNIKWDESTYPLEFNFKREIQQGENPFDVNGSYYSISLTSDYVDPDDGDTAIIKGARIGDKNTSACVAPDCNRSNAKGKATFYYGRVRSSQFFYEDNIASVNTDISINVYCDLGFSVCNDFGINTSQGQTAQYEWWLSWEHSRTRGDGNVTLVVGDPLLKSSGSPTINTQANPNHTDIIIDATAGINTNVIVAEGANPILPMIVPIELVNNIETTPTYSYATTPPYTNRWLIYNEDTSSLVQKFPSPFYKVEFIGTSDWAGHGDTGHVVGGNSNTKKNSRSGW